jgi:peptidoglycan/LPS O-acetylase OafA/YrhL
MKPPVQLDLSQGPKIEVLESLRGLAAFLVVLSHVPSWHPSFGFSLIDNSSLMVELFFVLSGFVIYSAYSDKIRNRSELLRFQFLRLARLYPVHLLFLTAFLGIEVLKYLAQSKLGIVSPNSQPFVQNSGQAFVQQLLLLQAVGPTGNALSFNGPAWSISVEFYTYLFFGAVVLCFHKYKHFVFAALFLGASYVQLSGRTTGFEHLLSCFCGFFLGCLVAHAKNAWSLRLPTFMSGVSLALLVAYLTIKSKFEYDYLIYPLSALLVLSVVSSGTGWVKRALEMKLFTWLGSISYSMYMSHITLVWIANQVFRVLLDRPQVMVNGDMTPVLGFGETAAAYAVLLGSVLLVSHLCYRWIEKPVRMKSRTVRFGRAGESSATRAPDAEGVNTGVIRSS